MGKTAKLGIELFVDDKGSVKVKKFGSEVGDSFKKAADGSQTASQRIKKSWSIAGAALLKITGIIFALREAWEIINMSAKAKQERQAFENMAASYGASGEKIINELKKVSAGTVDTMTLVRKAGTAMMTGLNPEDVTKLMSIAMSTSRMTGQSVTEAFGDFAIASARQSKMILDNLGIMLDLGKAYDAHAKKLKKNASQLTDVEKKQAFLNAAVKEGRMLQARLGEQTNTAADRLERFKSTIVNLKVALGEVLMRGLFALTGAFKTVASGAMTAIGVVTSGIEKASNLISKIPGLSDLKVHLDSEAWKGAAEKVAGEADQAFKDAFSASNIKTGNAEMAKRQQLLQKQNQALVLQTKLQDKINKTAQDTFNIERQHAGLRESANQKMFNEFGIAGEAYFKEEAGNIVEMAARWQKAGVAIEDINKYLYEKMGKLSEEAFSKGEDSAGEYLDMLQSQADFLVKDYKTAQDVALDRLNAMGAKVQGLDGSQIGLTVTLYDQASSNINAIISRFHALKNATQTASVSTGNRAATSKPSNYSGTNAVPAKASSSTIIQNFNQNISRNDAVNIATESARRTERG